MVARQQISCVPVHIQATRNFQATVWERIGAKLCRFLALQEHQDTLIPLGLKIHGSMLIIKYGNCIYDWAYMKDKVMLAI